MFGTYKRPAENQCASLVSKPALYKTHWDIISETIRVRQQEYEASSNADSTAPLRVLLCPSSLYSKNEQDSSPAMLRIKQRTHAQNEYITSISFYSFLNAYKAQVKKTTFDQIIRNNHFGVMIGGCVRNLAFFCRRRKRIKMQKINKYSLIRIFLNFCAKKWPDVCVLRDLWLQYKFYVQNT